MHCIVLRMAVRAGVLTEGEVSYWSFNTVFADTPLAFRSHSSRNRSERIAGDRIWEVGMLLGTAGGLYIKKATEKKRCA